MRTLLRWFTRARRRDAGAWQAEIQYAGWVATPAELCAEVRSIRSRTTAGYEPETLVARFYSSQEC